MEKPEPRSVWELPPGTEYKDMCNDILWPCPMLRLDGSEQVAVLPVQDPEVEAIQVVPTTWEVAEDLDSVEWSWWEITPEEFENAERVE